MKYSSLLVTAALAGSLGLPVAVQAQVSNGGSSNYGIFGGGTNNGSGSGFGRSSGFGPNQSSGFGQQSFGGSTAGGFGRSAAIGVGSSPTLSPYLNLLRPGSTAVNYYSGVRPQIHQDLVNTQNANSIQQTDRFLIDQQQRLRQTQDPNLANENSPLQGNRVAEPAVQTAQRRRVNDPADADFHDWASDFKGQTTQGDARTSMDSRQRAANLRRAAELKALEKELEGNADSSTNPTPPAQTSGQQPNNVLINPNLLRPANHYYPTPGVTTSRVLGPR
jgi:hypothetical protein